MTSLRSRPWKSGILDRCDSARVTDSAVGLYLESQCLFDERGSGSHGDASVLGVHRQQREHDAEFSCRCLERRHLRAQGGNGHRRATRFRHACCTRFRRALVHCRSNTLLQCTAALPDGGSTASFDVLQIRDNEDEEENEADRSAGKALFPTGDASSGDVQSIAVLVDAETTSFLMMGLLSSGKKARDCKERSPTLQGSNAMP